MTKHIFVAEFKYGSAVLMMVGVEKETPKTYVSASEERIIGWCYVSRRILKGDPGVFESGTAALEYLQRKAEQYTANCRKALEKALDQQEFLIESVAHSRANEEQENDQS